MSEENAELKPVVKKARAPIAKRQRETVKKIPKEVRRVEAPKTDERVQFLNYYNTIKNSCTNGRWVDQDFPAAMSSLIGKGATHADTGKGVEFKRLKDIAKFSGNDVAIFKDRIEPNDISQGELGDCYFLSALACLAEKEQRISDLFVTDEMNAAGVFGVIFCKNGVKEMVMVDDYFPCKHGSPCYS